MKPKHTQGPWKLTHNNRISFITFGPLNSPIADIPKEYADNEEIHIKNSYLLAAAPDLLIGLKEAIRELHFTLDDIKNESNYLSFNEFVEKLERIVAKADGRNE